MQLPVPGGQHCLCLDRANWMPSLRSSLVGMALPLSLNGTAHVFSAIRAGLYKRAIIAAAIYLRALQLRHLSQECRRTVARGDTCSCCSRAIMLPAGCCSAMIYVNVKYVLSSCGRRALPCSVRFFLHVGNERAACRTHQHASTSTTKRDPARLCAGTLRRRARCRPAPGAMRHHRLRDAEARDARHRLHAVVRAVLRVAPILHIAPVCNGATLLH